MNTKQRTIEETRFSQKARQLEVEYWETFIAPIKKANTAFIVSTAWRVEPLQLIQRYALEYATAGVGAYVMEESAAYQFIVDALPVWNKVMRRTAELLIDAAPDLLPALREYGARVNGMTAAYLRHLREVMRIQESTRAQNAVIATKLLRIVSSYLQHAPTSSRTFKELVSEILESKTKTVMNNKKGQLYEILKFVDRTAIRIPARDYDIATRLIGKFTFVPKRRGV